jgi:hypothetical protein
MASLIITNPLDKSKRVTKYKVSIDNWRAIGAKSKNHLFIITRSLHCYSIEGISIEQFIETSNIGLDVPKSGRFERVALACQKCRGRGLIDWVTSAMGAAPYIMDSAEKFQRDPKSPILMCTTHQLKPYPSPMYFSRCIRIEPYELCKECEGTGLHLFRQCCKTLSTEKVKEIIF